MCLPARSILFSIDRATMKIKMTKTVQGSTDGIRVTTYNAGVEYDLTGSPGARDLAQAFVNARMAVEAKDDPAPPVEQAQIEPATAGFFTPEEKAIEAAPENKMLDTGKRPYNRKAK